MQRKSTSGRRLSRRDLLAGSLGAVLLGGCRRRAPRPAGSAAKEAGAPRLGRPHIVLLVLDTVRADHVGAVEGMTPNIDRIAAEGVRFERAYSSAAWTLPSHGSLFTGHEPRAHGQTHAAVREDAAGISLDPRAALPGRFTTLAAALGEIGYQRLGLSQNFWVGRLSTQDAGFGRFWELWRDDGALPFPPRRSLVRSP